MFGSGELQNSKNQDRLTCRLIVRRLKKSLCQEAANGNWSSIVGIVLKKWPKIFQIHNIWGDSDIDHSSFWFTALDSKRYGRYGMKAFWDAKCQLVYGALAALLILVVVLSIPNTAAAATYYVAMTGKDANPGTQASPFRTIAKGISALKAGDTLYIRTGTYTESIDDNKMTIPTGTSWEDAIRIAGYMAEKVTITNPGAGQIINLGEPYIKYLIFDNIIVDATEANFGIGLRDASHIRFNNVEVKNSVYSGILVNGPQELNTNDTYYEFIGMKVHDCGTHAEKDHGIYMMTSSNLIENGLWYDNKAFGIHLYNGVDSKAVNNNIIRNNRVYNNGNSSPNGGGIIAGCGGNNIIYNNLIYGNLDGMRISMSVPTNNKIYNNTIYNNARYGLYIVGNRHIVRNNIMYSNALANYYELAGSTEGITKSNNLTTDPSFMDASANNFNLRSGSSAIDAGYNLSAVFADDMAGTKRPQGGAFDIGAYEFLQGNQPPKQEVPKNLRIDNPQ
jgi:hypothetical protein